MGPTILLTVAVAAAGPYFSVREVASREVRLRLPSVPNGILVQVWRSADLGHSWQGIGGVPAGGREYVASNLGNGEHWFGFHVVLNDDTELPPWRSRPGWVQRVRVRAKAPALAEAATPERPASLLGEILIGPFPVSLWYGNPNRTAFTWDLLSGKTWPVTEVPKYLPTTPPSWAARR